jgi:single-strand DNA-binding protein
VHEPTISVIGNLGGDPQLRYTPNGVAVCEVRMATTPSRKVGEEWHDKETIWFRLSCWRELGENVAATLRKGDRVVVLGKLLQNTYEKRDGSTGTDIVIDVTSIGPDLKRCTAEVKRPVRAGSTAELMPEKWVDKETGEIMTAPPLGDAGPLVPYSEEQVAV